MTANLSPQGLLLKLSKVYAVGTGEERRITEVPKQVRKIAEKLEFKIFPNIPVSAVRRFILEIIDNDDIIPRGV